MDDRRDVEQTAAIVVAYVAKNSLSPSDLPVLITTVHKAVLAATGHAEPEPEPAKPPAVTVRRSIQPDHLVCLEDGRKFRSLKKHLRAVHNLSPDGYRAKWRLPGDYPMVAPSSSQARSILAKAIGLGIRTPKGAKRVKRAPKP